MKKKTAKKTVKKVVSVLNTKIKKTKSKNSFASTTTPKSRNTTSTEFGNIA
jgi:hypothetical protein